MFTADTLVGVICHIHARHSGGPRYRPDLSPEEVRAFDNLILFCAQHHKIVDDHPDQYDPETLRGMKADHELRADDTSAEVLRGILDRLVLRVPNSWWQRPGAPLFQVNLSGNKPPSQNWVFSWDLEQIDGGDVGDLRYAVRHANTQYDLAAPDHLIRRRKWHLRELHVQPRGEPVELELRFWWDGDERSLTYRWPKEDDFQRVAPELLYG